MLDPNIYPKMCKIICCVRSLIIINLGMVFSVTGCAPVLRVLPPTIYDTNNGSIYDSLSPELKTTAVDVFYFTDRQPKTNESEVRGYGDKRSSRLAYGLARVELGDWQNWDELVDWTLSSGQATGRLAPRLVGIEEKGQFPETPYLYSEDASGHVSLNPEIKREINLAVNNTRRELQSRLALTPVKDVFLYIHGIQTSFEKAVTHAAVYDHFTGRSGVSIAYCWPSGGKLRFNYARDRESGEFTIFHLKELLRSFAEISEIEQVHVLAHSRGTDIAVSALRELIIEVRAAGHSPRQYLKLANLVLFAADIDLDVIEQRFEAEALGPAFSRITVYTNTKDIAIATSTLLFGSRLRLGKLYPQDYTPRDKALHQLTTNADIILYEGRRAGGFGHTYYRNSSIMSDIMLLLQGHSPGSANGRPLKPLGDRFWELDDNYLR